ncbi:MAG: amino acid adenylation domain-containing protein, partial [Algicola sp.]|nr:amino acid adenylation domain-containing protein [Algicola sp.]
SVAQVKEAAQLKRNISALKITHLHATPGYLSALGEFTGEHHLKRVISGGDVVHSELKQLWQDKLINEYGPTENTVTAVQCLDYAKQPGINCIGKPLSQYRVYVLLLNQKQAPVGVPGELFIGGAGVARGYLNLPELTNECFVVDPFTAAEDARMYKTGDLVRWLPNGNLEYLGRNDMQVKIRGYRIELEEIQSALTDLPQVKQAVVIDIVRAQNRVLAAFVVKNADQAVVADQLRDSLSARMPDYMVPSTFTFVDAIPLTVNGKLDRAALPEPELVDSDNYVAPQDELEQQLCAIWQTELGLEKIGVQDNFFALGGDSVSGIRITAAIVRALDIELTLALMFDQPDISRLAASIRRGDVSQDTDVILHEDLERYPLSFSQDGLLFIEEFERHSNVYLLPYFVKLDNPDMAVLEAAFALLVNRHPVLNSICESRGEHNFQRLSDIEFKIQTHPVDSGESLMAVVKNLVDQPFYLRTQPWAKIHYLVDGQHQYLLMLFHHIALDGWSTDILMKELAEVYQALINGKAVNQPQPDIIYGDYARWQREQLQGQKLDNLLGYWTDHLSGFETLALATDYPRPSKQVYHGHNIDFELDPELSAQLRLLARTEQTTLYTVLLGGFYVTLAAMSGQTDVVLGTPSDNRQQYQTQSVIGHFVNSLAIRANVEGCCKVSNFIAQVHGIVTQGKKHQDLPFEKVVAALDIHRDASRHPIFQVMFGVQNFFEGKDADHPLMGQLPFAPIEAQHSLDDVYCPAKFDLSLFINDAKSQLSGVINYASSVFQQTSIERLSTLYKRVLRAFVDDQQQCIADIELLSTSERQMVLHDWNSSTVDYPQLTLNQLFERQVEETPDNIALVSADLTLSYRQLNEKANQMAHAIVASTAKANTSEGTLRPNSMIALYLERSCDMVIAMLAVLKAGGAYVPVSPKYPKDRVEFMLEDTDCALVVSCKSRCQALDSWDRKRMVLVDDVEHLAGQPISNPNPAAIDINLAYVLFTSGTTGKPKGVLTPHRGVSSLLIKNKEINLCADDVLVHLSDPNFDAATLEVWGALLHGAKLVVAQVDQSFEPAKFEAFIEQHQINVMWLTKSLFDQLYVAQPLMFKNLRCLLIGGEALNPVLIRQLVAQLERPQVILNGYGPTESTTFTTLWRCESFTGSVPLGPPTNNRQAYVLNEQHKLVALGCPGELYIGGDGLATGYLKRQELTEAYFVSITLGDMGEKLLYKSGDLVRWLPGGNLEYLGRTDSQVKIRGFRIELEEIQGVFNDLPSVKQAAVIDLVGTSSLYLAAYLVMEPGYEPDVNDLKSQLSKHLPDYMVPSTMTFIDELPLTANGKLDRRALPAPESLSSDDYEPPRDPMEQQLCSIWQVVLDLKQVGIRDNFFRSGGNSIRAIRMTAMIANQMNLDVPLALLFEHPDIANLAGQLSDCDLLDDKIIISHEEHAHYPLSFAQERLLFIESFEQGSDAYHIPYLVELEQADLSVLEAAFNIVIDRHPVLKTVFLNTATEGNYQQVLTEKINIQSKTLDCQEQFLRVIKAHIRRPFDLSSEPSIKLHHYVMGGAGHKREYLLMLFHHIAFDGWSTDIFMGELAQAYSILSEGREPLLPKLDISYGDYAQWQREYLQGENLEKLLSYWREQLGDFEALALSTDHPRPAIPNYRGMDLEFVIDEALSAQLRNLAKAQKTSLFSVSLSAFYITLAAMTGQTDVVVGTPADNRHHFQTQSLVGFFVNSLALRAQVGSSQNIEDLVKQVHKIITQGKAHEELPFEKLVEELRVERDTSRHPLYQVMFSVQSFFKDSDGNDAMNKLPFEPSDLLAQHRLYNPAKFDFSLFLNDGQSRITGVFNYAVSLFEPATMSRLSAVYQRVLRALVDVEQQPRPIGQIELLSEQERLSFLNDWQPVDAKLTQTTFVQMFEAKVVETPDAVALVFDSDSLTYQQLNEKANQLAHVIRHAAQQQSGAELAPDTLIAMYLHRSAQTIISIFAILKAGAAYVPIAVDFPQPRVTFILEDTQAPIVLTTTAFSEALTRCTDEASTSPQIVLTDDPLTTDSQPVENPQSIVTPQSLAYVIYTSGTTGNPKGVMLEHGVYACFIAQACQYLTASLDCDRVSTLSLTQYTFDIFGLEYGVTLATGGQLVLSQINTAFEDLSQHKSVLNFIQQTPSLWQMLFQDPLFGDCDQEALKKMQIMVGGESGNLDLFEQLDRVFGRVHQVYGPTETCIWSTRCVYASGKQNIIGTPFAGEQVLVLSDTLQLKPIGAPGQLYIGGVGLARGYLNRDELTRETFIDNPFDGGKTRLYKTGDRVRWLNDGQLEFLGRDDGQIKMRGYRIELGEIERVISQHQAVNTAVVTFDNQPDNARLLGYVTLNKAQDSTDKDTDMARELRDWLKGHLPGYMVPAHISLLEKFELNASGKINRKALKLPTTGTRSDERRADERRSDKPNHELEQQMLGIWQDLLQLDNVTVHDTFFDLGGHSLLMTKLKASLDAILDKPVMLVELFQYPTIEGLVTHLNPQDQQKDQDSSADEALASRPKQDVTEDIAIVGMAGRFPGAADVDQFWQNIRDGVSGIYQYSDEELLEQGVDAAMLKHPDYVKAGGYLEGCEFFDHTFFGYSPFEAQLIDPQQRMFLETAWKGIEHAGFDVQRMDNSVGVFGGMGNHSYLQRYLMTNPEVLARQGEYKMMISNNKDYIANRVAFKMGLTGPAFNVGMSCSSSLAAIHIACQSLRQGECNMAIAGGSGVNFPQQGYLYQQGMITSPDGCCRTFDADAHGTVPGGGVAVVVLMSLSRALAQGNTVYAVIKGSAINNDGTDKVGFTAPSVNGQANVIGKAMGGLDFESISYVEAHGTATPMGDPVEVAALTQAYRKHTDKKGYCALGSVKSNIGHLDVTAGIAGVIKTVQALKHQQLPPSLHFKKPNPNIDFDNSPFFVNQQLNDWSVDGVRRAGVSSFGIGGNNAHLVLEQAPEDVSGDRENEVPPKQWQLMCLSAKSETALNRGSQNLLEHMEKNTDLNMADMAFTLHMGRQLFDHRQFVVCQDERGVG